jgi:hypothetical protein
VRDRCPAIVPPFGAIEHTRPRSREVSALTPQDIETSAADWRRLDTPTITRRAAADHVEWRDLPDEDRAEMRDMLVDWYAKRLGDARVQVRLLAGIGDVPLAAVERVARLERALDAVRRLP